MNYVCRHGKKVFVNNMCPTATVVERKHFEAQFVKLPAKWIKQLETSKAPGTFKLAHQILRESFKCQQRGGEIVLSTEVTRLSRKVRSKAVRELVRLGLIEMTQRGNQAVRVTRIIS